jgi:tRNA dimethylallyltransferase
MFEGGLLEETRQLMDRYGEEIPALDALGYRQARQVLRGELSREQAIAAAQQGHRNYAKRQITWFRKEPEARWIEDFGDSPAAMAATARWIEAEVLLTCWN